MRLFIPTVWPKSLAHFVHGAQYGAMHKRIIFVFLVALSVFFSFGCGGEPETITQSGGEYYAEWFEADCQALASCGAIAIGDIGTCTDAKTQAGCSLDQRVCAENYTVPADEWDACLDAMLDRTCEGIINGILPTECLTINELF